MASSHPVDRTRRAAARFTLICASAAAALLLAGAAEAGAAKPKPPTPMIFVHGQSGSMQQFETNTMRLTSNGFPHQRIFAYEYNTNASTNDVAVAELDGFIAKVKEKTGAAKVDMLAHSRGTTVMHEFLSTPSRAAEVRRYVNFDGRTARLASRRRPDAGDLGRGRPDARDRRRRERLLPAQGAHRGDHLARRLRRALRVPPRPGAADEGRGARASRPGPGRRQGERLPGEHGDRGRRAQGLRGPRRDRRPQAGRPGVHEGARAEGLVRPVQGRRPQALRVHAHPAGPQGDPQLPGAVRARRLLLPRARRAGARPVHRDRAGPRHDRGDADAGVVGRSARRRLDRSARDRRDRT